MGHDSLIARWPSIAAFARDIGVKYQLAYFMASSGSIAQWHWPRVVNAAARRGIEGVTYEILAELASEVKRTKERAS